MMHKAVVCMSLWIACACSAQEPVTPSASTAASPNSGPTTMSGLSDRITQGVVAQEVSDYVYGGYQGDFPSPPHADLNSQRAFIIGWRDFPFRFVFSHEASYCPWFELPSGGAVSYQFFEGNLGWAELFNRFGRQECNSSVEILEPGPDRVRVRWTYCGVNMETGQQAYRGVEDFWAYPNGLIVRRQTFHSLLPDDHRGYAREPMELIGLCPAGKRWSDVQQRVTNSEERHALAVLDVFSDKRYDVYWRSLPGMVWDSAHRRSGCAWRDLDNSPGVIMAVPLTDGAPFCAFGDRSGFHHDTTRIKDLTYTNEAWGSISWDHWPIGWLNSQAHVVDAESWKKYPSHFSPLGMDLFALSDQQVADREFYSLLGVSGGDWESTRRSVRSWLESASGRADPNAVANLPAVWNPEAQIMSGPEPDTSSSASPTTRPTPSATITLAEHRPFDFGQWVAGFQDEFSTPTRDPRWKAVPAEPDGYRQADGVLHVTTMNTNPSHLLYEGAAYDGAVQEVLARMRIVTTASGPNPMAGIAVGADPSAAHAGEAINCIFILDPGDCLGAAGPVVRLIDDWRAWGPAVPDFFWKPDVWYWVRLKQTGSIPVGDPNIYAKIWRADGTEPEPNDWQMEWAREGRTGLAGICGPHDNAPAAYDIDYILIKAAGLPRIQVTAGASAPQSSH